MQVQKWSYRFSDGKKYNNVFECCECTYVVSCRFPVNYNVPSTYRYCIIYYIYELKIVANITV